MGPSIDMPLSHWAGARVEGEHCIRLPASSVVCRHDFCSASTSSWTARSSGRWNTRLGPAPS